MARTFDYLQEHGENPRDLRIYYEVVNVATTDYNEPLSPSNIVLLEVLEITPQEPNGIAYEMDDKTTQMIISMCIEDFDDDTWSYYEE